MICHTLAHVSSTKHDMNIKHFCSRANSSAVSKVQTLLHKICNLKYFYIHLSHDLTNSLVRALLFVKSYILLNQIWKNSIFYGNLLKKFWNVIKWSPGGTLWVSKALNSAVITDLDPVTKPTAFTFLFCILKSQILSKKLPDLMEKVCYIEYFAYFHFLK